MSADVDNLKLLGEHRQGETFEVGCHKFVDFLSHGTVLDDCTVVINGSSRGVVFSGATLRNCRIVSKRRFSNFSWHDVVLDRCTFEGWFVGCDFGRRPDAYPAAPQGLLSDCDFSAAQLHQCRIFRSELTRLKLPAWPNFTVADPEAHASDWLSIPFPNTYGQVEQRLIAEAVPEYRVSGVVGACEHAGEIGKRHKISVEEIRTLLLGKLYVIL